MFEPQGDMATTPAMPEISQEDMLEQIRLAWEEGWLLGKQAGQRKRLNLSHTLLIALAVVGVIVALVTLVILATAVGGYMDNLQASNALRDGVLH